MYGYDHGGDIYAEKDTVLDFSINVNPLGMPDSVKEAAEKAVTACGRYPDHSCRKLRQAISIRFGAEPETVICGNGASDLIYRLFTALRPPLTLLAAPSFSEYEKAARLSGGGIKRHVLRAHDSFEITESFLSSLTPDVKLVFLCNPNNPTGRLLNREVLGQIMETCAQKDIFLAVDECFLELSEGWADSLIGYVREYKNLFILRAFTKDYAIPGLRLGYGFCGDEGLLEKMNRLSQPWSVSIPAEAAGIAACGEPLFLSRSRDFIRREREKLTAGLRGLGLNVTESETNFILFRAPDESDLKERMRRRGILIRARDGFHGLPEDYYRIAVRTEAENRALLQALTAELKTSVFHDKERSAFGNV